MDPCQDAATWQGAEGPDRLHRARQTLDAIQRCRKGKEPTAVPRVALLSLLSTRLAG
jgi:hypothetical protein